MTTRIRRLPRFRGAMPSGSTRPNKFRRERKEMAATSGSSPAWTFVNNDAEKDRRTHQFIALVTALFATAVAWSWFAELDEVSTGSGKVVPSRQEQVIQSLEGGVLAQLYVRENEVVEPGQVLAQLDQTMSESSVEESAARYRAAL